jgi:hypothetical protein
MAWKLAVRGVRVGSRPKLGTGLGDRRVIKALGTGERGAENPQRVLPLKTKASVKSDNYMAWVAIVRTPRLRASTRPRRTAVLVVEAVLVVTVEESSRSSAPASA